MIIKSLSRKAATFRQLKAYMDRDGAPGVGFAWNLRMPWFASDAEIIRAFTDNVAVLKERRGGVKLYHEIVSLKRDDRLPLEVQQQILHDVVMEWLAARAPEQLAYGRLHVAREHLHVHIMLSANRQGDERPVRLTRAEFASLQRQVEGRILARYPELRQERTYDVPERAPRSFRHPRPEQQERSAQPDPGSAAEASSDRSVDRDHVAAVVRDALAHAADGRSCLEALRACEVVTHRRGSTVSFAYRDRRYRLLSLGLPYESASRFHAYLGLPPPSPARVAREERQARDAQDAQASPEAATPERALPQEPGHPASADPVAPAPTAEGRPGGTSPAPSWRTILKRQPAALARDLRRMLDLGLFGDTRSAYWGELVRAFQTDHPAGAPPRRDLPGTRQMPLAWRRILGAVQDEPAAFARDLRRLFGDVVLGARRAEPSLEELASSVGFRSSGPWRPLPRWLRHKLKAERQPEPGTAPAEPARATDGSSRQDAPTESATCQPPPAQPDAPAQPTQDPRWETEWRRRQAVRMALLRSYVRRQEHERQRELKRQRKRGRDRGDPGMGGQ